MSLIGFLFISSIEAQMHFKIDGILVEKVYLEIYRGDELRIVDSATVSNDEFWFDNTSYKAGIYRLVLGNKQDANLFDMEVPAIEFIGGQTEMSFHTSYFAPQKNLEIIKSSENEIYYKYLKLDKEYKEKLVALLNLLSKYSEQDPFYLSLSIEIVRLQEDFHNHLLSLISGQANTFISAYLQLMREPIYDPSSGIEIKEFMKENFFDPIDFNYPVLINSPVIPQKIFTFLSLYTNSEYDQNQQEKAFIKAIDEIMEELKYNQEIYDFVLNFLIEVFERFQMEIVLVHIADNHLSGECETDNEKIIQERLVGYQAMAEGKIVKKISLLNELANPVSLSSINAEYTLIVFWATWCHHCTKLLPQLHKWYLDERRNLDLEIFAVAIDSSKADWEEFVFLNDLKWYNVIDTKGWEGKVARQYNLYATPTMFLINKKREILSKPLTLRELNRYFKEN